MAKDQRGLLPDNKFRDSTNSFLVRALFFETNTFNDKAGCLYTLKESDHKGYLSLHKSYMEIGDPTEYKFALTHFEGWSHWQRLLKCKWFMPYVERWRAELAVKLASQGLSTVVAEVTSNGKGALVAAKYLIEKGWVAGDIKPKRKPGRPKKEDVKMASGLTQDIEEAALSILGPQKEFLN
jgi:hypothetical protein